MPKHVMVKIPKSMLKHLPKHVRAKARAFTSQTKKVMKLQKKLHKETKTWKNKSMQFKHSLGLSFRRVRPYSKIGVKKGHLVVKKAMGPKKWIWGRKWA